MHATLTTKQKHILLAVLLFVGALLAIIGWASTKQVQLFGPGALAIDSQGRTWLNVDHDLFILSGDGNILQQLDIGQLAIAGPIGGMTAFRDGEMLVGSRGSGTIYRLDQQGQVVGRLGADSDLGWQPFGAFHLVYHRTWNRIVVADTSNHRVLLLDDGGHLLHASAAPHADSDRYRFPNAVIVNGGGDVVVVDTNHHSVDVLDDTLSATIRWQPVIPSNRYAYPVFIAQTSHGDYYLSIHDARLNYAEVVRLDNRGERQGLVTFETKVIPNGMIAYGNDVLLTDAKSYAVWRIHENGNSVSRFGGPSLLIALQAAKDRKAFYARLVTTSQGILISVLPILLIALVVARLHERRAAARTALPMDNTAKPPRQTWAEIKQFILLLPTFLLALFLALSLLVQVFGACSGDATRWLYALIGNAIVLLPVLALVWLSRRVYKRGIVRGRYHNMFVRRAHSFLDRHRPALAGALAPGEHILGVELGFVARSPALVVLTDQTLWVLTLSLFGTKVRRVQAISVAGVAAPAVIKQTGLLNFLKQGGIPLWRLEFVEAGAHRRYALAFPDAYGATRLAEHLKEQAARGGTLSTAVVRDVACPSCVESGKNPVVAALLSLTFPGLGQLYTEELYKGLVYLLSGAVLGLMALGPLAAYFRRTMDISERGIIVAVIMLAAVWTLALIDAVATTIKTRARRVGVHVLD